MASRKPKKGSAGTILIIEDVYMVRRTLHLMLESDGYKVVEAKESQEAMHILQEGLPPDLIILDIAMPGVDGLDFLRVLRTHKDTKTIPVMMCTARGEENTIKLARQYGANEFMVKPVNRDTLLGKVSRIFQEHPPAAARESAAPDSAPGKEEAASGVNKPKKKSKKKSSK